MAQKLYEPQSHGIKPTSLEEHNAARWAILNTYQRAKVWIAIKITTALGTMECAFLFVCLAIYGFPQHPTPQQLVQWISQTLIQLTALSILGNGQQILGQIQEHIITEISKNVTIVLHQDTEMHRHIDAQDDELIAQSQQLRDLQEAVVNLKDTVIDRDNAITELLAAMNTRLDAMTPKDSSSSFLKRLTRPLQKAGKHD
jgi:hypothetical protein